MPAEPRTFEQRNRAALVALADWLTDRDDYDIPVEVVRALTADEVTDGRREMLFHSLLLFTSERGPDRSRPLPYHVETDLDYLTGTR